MEWKGWESIRYLAHYLTMHLDLSHDHDVEFLDIQVRISK